MAELMGTKNKIMLVLKAHVGFLAHRMCFNEFLVEYMLRFLSTLWLLISSCMCHVFGFLFRYVIRYQGHESSEKSEVDKVVDRGENCEETSEGNEEMENSFALDSALAANTSKCQFTFGRDIIGFMERPENVCFSVQECFVASHDFVVCYNRQLYDKGDFAQKESRECEGVAEAENCEVVDENSCNFRTEKMLREEEEEEIMVVEDRLSVVGEDIDLEDSLLANIECSDYQESESVGSCEGFIRVGHDADFISYEFLPDKNVCEESEPKTYVDTYGRKVEDTAEVRGLVDFRLYDGSVSESKKEFFRVQQDDYENEFSLLDQHLQNSVGLGAEKIPEDGVCEDNLASRDTEEMEEVDGKKAENVEEIRTMEDVCLHDESVSDSKEMFVRGRSDDHNDKLLAADQHLLNSIKSDAKKSPEHVICDTEFVPQDAEVMGTFDENQETSFPDKQSVYYEDDPDDMDKDHDDLVQHLKSELKRVRTGGLPTILEESESPKLEEDYLRPLKIDDKFEHKDRIEEIQKVYKSYAEKMRKLDILNYQALNAISLHQKKDPNCLTSSYKLVNPTIKSFFPKNLYNYKARRIAVDPTLKCIENLHKDLEMVYVGQVCLSWEILCWQHWKAIELQENDSQGFCQYNQVANEFQLLQVLVQRFLEDERFQGPRVLNYVNNRCNFRSLLQVPAIKDDSMKDRTLYKGVKQTDAISCRELVGIIKAAMQVFWEFLCSDKDAELTSKGSRHAQIELHDSVDSELLNNVRSDLQKKEKKLKDIIRSGNCIIKKLQKCRGDHLHQALFIAQVELKIVSRVINMSKLNRNQLLWCQEKLDKIDFASRRIHVEPLFSFFPC